MENIFAKIILGHLVGDYLLQNKKMALTKTEKGLRGIMWCTLHSLIYTATVCLFLWTVKPIVIILVFLSHWPIDRWSLASWWLKLIGGRDFMSVYRSNEKYKEISLIFSCLVYVVVDNTFHILFIWLIAQYCL